MYINSKIYINITKTIDSKYLNSRDAVDTFKYPENYDLIMMLKF